MRLLYTITFGALFLASQLKAQLTTSQALTPQQLVQNVLLGGGVTASNITYTGNLATRGTFNGVASNIGLPNGVLLTCGSNVNAIGPNNNSAINGSNGLAGDPDLDLIMSPTNSFDATVLEFDFVPSSDTLRFRYVFGSEEYMEYVSTLPGGINDGFGFFISGPGITGPFTNNAKNIALIPGTSLPVTMFNLNLNTNSAFYFDNGDGTGSGTAPDGATVQYDGFTVPLTAITGVQCGQTYHIKLAIADGGDGIIDSGVFLEGGSFSSLPPINLNTTNANSNIPDSILVEDCNTNCINFIRNGNIANADSFNLQVTGNAILGVDYIQNGNPGFAWPTVIHFAANQDTLKYCNLTALQDGLVEGLDTIKFTMSSFVTNTLSCASSNSIKFNLYVKDYTPISIAQNDVTLCSGTSTILNAGASFGYPTYTYSLSSPAVTTPTLNTGPISSPTIFTITVNDICNKPVTKQITVTPVAIPSVTVNDTILCAGNPGFLFASGASTYSWSSGATTSSVTVSPTTTTTYTVVGSVGTCSNSAVSTVTVIGQAISITGNNAICSGQSSTLTASGGAAYTWDNGTTTNTIIVTPTVNTTYTVTSIAASCTNMAVYTVSVTSIPNINITGSVTCPGQSTTLTASGAAFYNWSTGSNTFTTSVAPTVNTSYTVTGTVSGCSNFAIYTVTVIPTPAISVSPPNPLICSGDTAVLSASGASSYTWSTGATTFSTSVNPMSTTNYTVVGSVGSCTTSAVVTVTAATQLIAISGNNSICIGQSSTLSASGGTLYSWSTGASTPSISVSPTTTTVYSVTSSIGNCTNTAPFTVSVTPKPVINITGTTICPGQNGIITATGATTYTWSTGATTSVINVNPSTNTTYTVMGTTIPTCTDTAVYTINVITSQPNALAVVASNILCLDSIGLVRLVISNGNPPYMVNWIIPVNGIVPFDTINNVYYFTQSGTPSNENYTIIVTDQCLFKDTITVNLQTVDCNIIVPNVVTPNGDGINDFFRVNGLENFPGSSLTAFNRWGNKIYNSDDYKNDWAPSVTDGTYFYIINISDGRKLNGFFQVFKN
jgi:gliding motility-associated-like protein